MRKWVVLALGVLLAVAGLLSIWQGAQIIQIESGWASVISGAVLVAGGSVTIAIFFVLEALEGLQRKVPAPAFSEPEAVTEEPKVASFEPTPAPFSEPDLKLPPAPVLPPFPLREEAPAPVVNVEPAPAAKVEEPVAAPAVTVAAATSVAVAASAAGGLFGFRNFLARRAAAKAVPPEVQEPGAPKLPDFLVRRDVMLDQPKIEEPVSLEDETQSSEEQPIEEPRAEGPSDADKYSWLERALSGEDEKPEPEFDWLRNRTTAEPIKEPILEEVNEEEPAGQEVQEPVAEEPAAQIESAPEEVAPPTVIGRYNSGGSEYTLYSDGSIDAETADGHLHFASMADLRAHIEAQQNRE
jgi:hypothetical protein